MKVLSSYTLLLSDDYDASGFRAYGGKGLPFLIVIGKDGRIVSMRSGYGRGERDDLASELTQALRVTPDNSSGT